MIHVHMYYILSVRSAVLNLWEVQERPNSIANTLELRLSCINPSKCHIMKMPSAVLQATITLKTLFLV